MEFKSQHNVYDYGECEICDTPLQEQRVKQDFWIRGELVVIDNVVAGVCPQCGAKIVRADIGQQLSALLSNPDRIANAPKLSVPIVALEE